MKIVRELNVRSYRLNLKVRAPSREEHPAFLFLLVSTLISQDVKVLRSYRPTFAMIADQP